MNSTEKLEDERGSYWLDLRSYVFLPRSLYALDGFWVALECVVKLELAFSFILKLCCFKWLGNLHHLGWGLGNTWGRPYSYWVLFPGRAGAASRALWSCLIANIGVPCHDTGFCLPPLLFQTQTPIAIFTFIHWLLLWQSRIHLSLRSLKFFLGTRDTWSSREIIRTFLHSHRNLCKLQISQSLQKKKNLDVNVLLA